MGDDSGGGGGSGGRLVVVHQAATAARSEAEADAAVERSLQRLAEYVVHLEA